MGFGTSTTSNLGRERALARAVLAILVGSLAMLIAFSGGSFNPLTAIAQESPSPTSQFTIQFLNPSSGQSSEISAKSDGTDSLYHLVAAVNEVPPSPLVEFKIQAEGENEITIGQATRVGTTDTFHLFWDVAASGLDDGEYTLRAILFSNQQEVARDVETVNLNNDNPTSPLDDPQFTGETVEITAPTNAGPAGFYTNPEGSSNTVVDVTSSADTTFVRVFYTISGPGTEPTWTTCGTERQSASADGVRCTLESGDSPSSVTALAAIANDTPDPEGEGIFDSGFNDSGDAHRVFPYTQVPTTVALAFEGDPPSNQASDVEVGACAPTLTATVTDQNVRKVAGLNVDFHASGPTDQLRFAQNGTGPFAAPDQNHTATEDAWDCSSAASAGSQAEHEVPGEGDTKHVESTAGTTDAGQFSVKLRSPDAGSTQITAWADTDGDDLFCSDEANGDASIGWGAPAPAATGLPADRAGPCPAGSPSPTPTGSPSPTPTQTGSPSPTPTQTGSPSPSPTDGEEECPPGAICGDDGDNNIQGTSGDDVIFGRGGDDVIRGRGGDDVIFGEGGNDVIIGGPGNDDLHGGFGDDTIRGNRGRDNLRGGPGADTLIGGRANDTLRGGGGRDTLRGNRGRDTLRGGGGNDTLRGGLHGDILVGGGRADVLRGGRGRDVLRGNNGSDSLRGGRANDTLRGGRGNDTLNGGRGTDLCRPGPGRDRRRNCER